MPSRQFDYLVVGAGPAGLAAAAKLAESGRGRVLVLEKGKSFERRACPAAHLGRCTECRGCDAVSGLGGASGVVGGKLCFFPAGARLADHVGASAQQANNIVAEFLLSMGYPVSTANTPVDAYEGVDRLHLRRYHALPVLKPTLTSLFRTLYSRVVANRGVVKTGAQVVSIDGEVGDYSVTYSLEGALESARITTAIVIATGRDGTQWLQETLRRLGLSARDEGVDVGIRLEFPSSVDRTVLEPALQDPKFKEFAGSSHGVRTLCWCRGGELSLTTASGNALIDGHFSDVFTPRTSVSLVSRIPNYENTDSLSTALMRYSGRPHSGGCEHQDLRSFMMRRMPDAARSFGSMNQRFRSTQTPLARRMDDSLWASLAGMVEQIDALLERRLMASANAVVYGPVVDRFWPSVQLDSNLMTHLDGVYIAGDSTGLARGIVQGFFAGVTVAASILQRGTSTPMNLAGTVSENEA